MPDVAERSAFVRQPIIEEETQEQTSLSNCAVLARVQCVQPWVLLLSTCGFRAEPGRGETQPEAHNPASSVAKDVLLGIFPRASTHDWRATTR